jgi:hypothetical protein
MLPFPDLLDQENAMRKSLAEQVQNRNLSLLEQNQQITKFHPKMLAEEQNTLLANPTTDAKVPAAATRWRVSNPDGCATLGGNKANCINRNRGYSATNRALVDSRRDSPNEEPQWIPLA